VVLRNTGVSWNRRVKADSPKHRCGICHYAWNMLGISLDYAEYMLRYARNMLGIFELELMYN
jgi:hypothetical protein